LLRSGPKRKKPPAAAGGLKILWAFTPYGRAEN
jgi:hypothetical protein